MDKKQVSFRVDATIIKKLKFLALEQDRSLTEMFLEGIEDLLKKYSQKAIAMQKKSSHQQG